MSTPAIFQCNLGNLVQVSVPATWQEGLSDLEGPHWGTHGIIGSFNLCWWPTWRNPGALVLLRNGPPTTSAMALGHAETIYIAMVLVPNVVPLVSSMSCKLALILSVKLCHAWLCFAWCLFYFSLEALRCYVASF